ILGAVVLPLAHEVVCRASTKRGARAALRFAVIWLLATRAYMRSTGQIFQLAKSGHPSLLREDLQVRAAAYRAACHSATDRTTRNHAQHPRDKADSGLGALLCQCAGQRLDEELLHRFAHGAAVERCGQSDFGSVLYSHLELLLPGALVFKESIGNGIAPAPVPHPEALDDVLRIAHPAAYGEVRFAQGAHMFEAEHHKVALKLELLFREPRGFLCAPLRFFFALLLLRGRERHTESEHGERSRRKRGRRRVE